MDAKEHACFLEGIGEELTNLKQAEDAIPVLRRCIEIKPDHAGCWLGLGNANEALNRFSEAKSWFTRLENFEVCQTKLGSPNSGCVYFVEASYHGILSRTASPGHPPWGVTSMSRWTVLSVTLINLALALMRGVARQQATTLVPVSM